MSMEEEAAAPTGPTGTVLTVPEQSNPPTAGHQATWISWTTGPQLRGSVITSAPSHNWSLGEYHLRQPPNQTASWQSVVKGTQAPAHKVKSQTQSRSLSSKTALPSNPPPHHNATLSSIRQGCTWKTPPGSTRAGPEPQGLPASAGHTPALVTTCTITSSSFIFQSSTDNTWKSIWFSRSVAFWKPFSKSKKGRAQKQELKHPKPQVATEKTQPGCLRYQGL